ncbi:MAG: hypothetical protein ABIQ18_27800 [Umezawaea sp.]
MIGQAFPHVGKPVALVGGSIAGIGCSIAFVGGLVAPVGHPVALVGQVVTLAGRSDPTGLVGLSGAQSKTALVVDIFPVHQALPLVGLITCDRRGRRYLGVDFLLIFAHFGSSFT